jgi:signal transduction histidine kinase
MERARSEAVAQERSRLARDLHDAVTQTLFSTTLTAEVLPKIWDRDPQEGRRKLEELRELTRGALAEMRTLLLELRPDALAESDLKDLLRHLGNAFNARARIPIHASVEGACDLPLEVKIAFYRVAQEALNNIAKHSQASQVALALRCLPGAVRMQVDDDGQGFDPTAAGTRDHFGLRIMRERAEQVGAQFEIRSQPGQGTHIHMHWQPPSGAAGEETA